MRASYGSLVVGWDGDRFNFGTERPDDALEVSKDMIAPTCAVGASFLSGKSNYVVYVNDDGSEYNFVISGPMARPTDKKVEDLKPNDSWSICGPGIKDKIVVRNFCERTKAYTVSVNPLGDYAIPFGYLAGVLMLKNLIKPRMTRFHRAWTEDIPDSEGRLFDTSIEGDGIGRMAHLVQARTPVVNQMMRTPSVKAFYGRVLTSGRWWGEPIFLMLPNVAFKYFPSELISIRNYAATWVPTLVKNTDRFAKTSGFGGSYVTIFVASELTPMLGSFLRFVEIMSKDEFIASSDPKKMPIPDKIPLFRNHSAYNISKDIFKEVVL